MNSDSSCFSRSMSVQLVVMLQIKKGDVIMSAHPFVTSCPQAVLRHRNIFFFLDSSVASFTRAEICASPLHQTDALCEMVSVSSPLGLLLGVCQGNL